MARIRRVSDNWERLMRATQQRAHLIAVAPSGTEFIVVPASLGGRVADIDRILQAANEIEDNDPNVARILCKSAYDMVQVLDPNSKGRGVLQFKTDLMSVIKAKTKPGVSQDRADNIKSLWNFYSRYKRHMRNEQRDGQMEKFSATLRALLDVLEFLVGNSTDSHSRQILQEINIIPLDAPLTNANVFFPDEFTMSAVGIVCRSALARFSRQSNC